MRRSGATARAYSLCAQVWRMTRRCAGTASTRCPTSFTSTTASTSTRASVAAPATTGPQYWRSLDELAVPFVHARSDEFPPHATELSALERRAFLKMMTASLALAGLAGCGQPVRQAVAYVKAPEEMLPGKPLYF